jgi:nitrogen-specific signal transduction histidine kinase
MGDILNVTLRFIVQTTSTRLVLGILDGRDARPLPWNDRPVLSLRSNAENDSVAHRVMRSALEEWSRIRGVAMALNDEWSVQLDGLLESTESTEESPSVYYATLPILVKGRPVGLVLADVREDRETRLALLHLLVEHMAGHLARLKGPFENHQNRLATIMEFLSEGVLLVDPDLRVLQSNAAARRILQNVIRQDDTDALTHIGGCSLREWIERFSLEGQLESSMEVAVATNIFLVRIAVIQEGDDSIGGYLVTVQDITAERTRQDQFFRNHRFVAIGKLASGVAHEINNPLTGIVGFSQYLLKKDLSDDVRECVTDIHTSAIRTRDIVAYLRDFARPADGPSLLSLQDIVRQTEIFFHKPLSDHNLTVSLELDESVSQLWYNRNELQDVVFNLLEYAVDAHAPSEGPGRIRISTQTDRSYAVLQMEITPRPLNASDPQTLSCLNSNVALVRQLVQRNGGTVQILIGDSAIALHCSFPVDL